LAGCASYGGAACWFVPAVFLSPRSRLRNAVALALFCRRAAPAVPWARLLGARHRACAGTSIVSGRYLALTRSCAVRGHAFCLLLYTCIAPTSRAAHCLCLYYTGTGTTAFASVAVSSGDGLLGCGALHRYATRGAVHSWRDFPNHHYLLLPTFLRWFVSRFRRCGVVLSSAAVPGGATSGRFCCRAGRLAATSSVLGVPESGVCLYVHISSFAGFHAAFAFRFGSRRFALAKANRDAATRARDALALPAQRRRCFMRRCAVSVDAGAVCFVVARTLVPGHSRCRPVRFGA